jgi:hypothetical protein
MNRSLLLAVLTLCFSPFCLAQHAATLSWIPSTSSEATLGYNIFRSTTSGTEKAPALNASPVAINCTSGACTYTDTTVIAGQTYYYVIQAFDTSDSPAASANSNEVSIPIPLNAGPPNAPTGLTVTAK